MLDGWLSLKRARGLINVRNERPFMYGHNIFAWFKKKKKVFNLFEMDCQLQFCECECLGYFYFFFFNAQKVCSTCSRLHRSQVLTLCTLFVNLSVSVVLEWRHAQLSLMALCSTCRLTGQGSTAPEADSHKQKLCVYWHQATTSLSHAGANTQIHRTT